MRKFVDGMMCRRFLSLLLVLLFSPSLFAQVEVNVKLYPGQTDLQRFLVSQNGRSIRQSGLDPTFLGRFPFLQDLRISQAAKLNAGDNGFASAEMQRCFTLILNDNQLAKQLNQLRSSGLFEFVEENRTRRLYDFQDAQLIPNDDSLARQWYHPFIRSFDAWDISLGSPNIKIGILDTGLDYDHPELSDNIAINQAEDANGNGSFEPWPADEIRNGISGDFDNIDADGNGFVDDVIGYDFTDQPRSPFGGDFLFEDSDPLDDNAHGTLTAGVIFAAHNGIGGAGLAPNCRQVVLRAFAANGAGEDDDISRAIVYAADNGVQILNFSFGDVYPSLLMHEAIRYAESKGVLMVGSAGNGTGDELHYPSGYNEVVSVSATTADLENNREFLWPLSSYGVTVDLAAPGSQIFTTDLRDTTNGVVNLYRSVSGTSFAAPMVSATAALILSQRGQLSPQQLRGILTSSTDDVSDQGWDHFTGAGRLNMLRALQVIGTSNVQITSPQNDRGSFEDSVVIRGTILDPEFAQWHLEYRPGTEDAGEWISILSDQPYQRQDDTLAVWNIRALPEGDYTLRLRLDMTNGFTAEDRIRFVRDTTPPEVDIRVSAEAWDNDIRKVLIVFRSSDQGFHTLHFRPAGGGDFQQKPFDRTTRNGDFLIGPELLQSGSWEYYIASTNLAGLSAQSQIQTIDYQQAYVPRNGFQALDYSLPLGRYVEQIADFDDDDLPEVVMSEYDSQLGFGKLRSYEFVGDRFRLVDSISTSPVLIPKDISDTDNDGLDEILFSVNDSMFVYEQENGTAFPSVETWRNVDNELFAASFADTDGDGEEELLAKNFKDYFLFENNGGSFSQVATLEDTTTYIEGSISPRAVVADFDNDNRPEILYGGFDSDQLVYEFQSSNAYELRYANLEGLTRTGSYLTAGDFDGDGIQEWFSASHTSSLRNEDFELNTPYWELRIFKSDGQGGYQTIWQDYLYDVDTDRFNAATAGNLDQDPADELLFSTYPRTYMIDFRNGKLDMAWFDYGGLMTHHIIHDFNGNGVNEMAIGRGDSAYFYEKDILFNGPTPVSSLTGKVLGPQLTQLSWQASPNATSYEVWRVPEGSSTATVFGPITGTSFLDNSASLQSGIQYLYILQALNPGLNPQESGFGNAVFLRPHERPRIDSLRAIGPRQLEVFFSQSVIARPENKAHFLLNESAAPITINSTGPSGKRLILSFREAFTEGTNFLRVDSLFTDAENACLDLISRDQQFEYEVDENESLHLTQWEATGDKEAIRFSTIRSMQKPLWIAVAIAFCQWDKSNKLPGHQMMKMPSG